MYYSELKIICHNLFGRSWKSQIADYFLIDKRRINDWSKKGGELPEFAKNKLPALIERRLKEAEHAKKMYNSFDCHKNAVFVGEVHGLDEDIITINEIYEFIQNQKWRVTEQAKSQKCEGLQLGEIIEIIESDFLSENDISCWCKRNDLFLDNMDEIEESRADAYFDVKLSIA